ncbi:MAG TPA: hypothetical protein VGM39_07035 [Kofleriaceae bacterium]|jgi:hypothetical protein
MGLPFLSPEWFSKVDELVAAAGDLQLPPEILKAEINATVQRDSGDVQVHLKNGVFKQGHLASAPTSLKLKEALARKIFVEGDNVAGAQAFMAGEMQAEGDLATLVQISTIEPTAKQKQLTKQIAEITA